MNTPVSFELAKLLKEKGFNCRTQANWWILAKDHSENYKRRLPVDESKVFFAANNDEYTQLVDIDGETYHNAYHVLSAPTIAEVVMWLYEKYGIWIFVQMSFGYSYSGFMYEIQNKEGGTHIGHKFNTPTEAYEAAIEYTLKNLIP